jgi:DNA-binding CsgD family transcriptional regulator
LSASVSPLSSRDDPVSNGSRDQGSPAVARFSALGLDAQAESAYHALLEAPGATAEEVGKSLSIGVEAVNNLVGILQRLELVHKAADGMKLMPVDPQLGLSALAARMDAELAMRRQQIEQGRLAISELVSDLGNFAQSNAGQLADVCWGARDITTKIAALAGAANREVVAMSTPTALAVDESVLPSRRIDGVHYRLVFAQTREPEPGRARWLRSLVEEGAEVRIGIVPSSALIIDRTTVALPVCDNSSGQMVGMATLRLGSVVSAVEELFERIWTDATPVDGSSSGGAGNLAPRERDLLALLVQGATDESAASHLGVSVRTVRRLVSDLMTRLEARSRFEAGARAAARGWLQMRDERSNPTRVNESLTR